MKQGLYSLLWLLGTALVFLAGCKTSESARVQPENALLWKIEGPQLQEPSYILGIIHVLPQKDYFFTESMQNALHNTQQVVLELDMDDPSLSAEMFRNATIVDGSTLDQLLSAKDYLKLDSLVKSSMGFGVEALKKWQPMMVASLALKSVLGQQVASYEMALVDMARTNQQEVLGLESVQDQTQALASIPYRKQAQYLSEVLNQVEQHKAIFAKMVSLYKSQDINGLLNHIVDQSGGIDFSTVLLNQRNHSWIAKITTLAAAKPSFFAVGAGHLPGKEGVLELLRKEGYRLTAIK